MRHTALSITLAAAVAAATSAAAPQAAAQAAAEQPSHPSIKRAFSLPPPADLVYTIKARQKGLSINGDATVQWRQGDGKYSIATESHAGIFGKILDSRSEGAVDSYGLAPSSFNEKRFRKEPTTATFKRDAKTITFSKGEESYPIKGGEQDRTSAPWQLAAIARSAPDKFTPGSEWAFFVAGRRDAEPWVFKVVRHEPVQTGVGEVEAVHFTKSPPRSDQGQQVDLWLAPSLDWYPVRIRFDDDGDTVDQLLDKVIRK
jgi:hypothetical protein